MPAMRRLLADLGVNPCHASRVFRALHRTGQPLSQVTNLGPRNAARIEAATRRTSLTVAERVEQSDRATRLVFQLPDGLRTEGVLLPNASLDRATLCISSQVGCAMACRFCATGTMGLTRNLTAGEIVAQVHTARRELAPRRLTHVVFMGMGEPLHNYEAVRDAVRVLLDPHGAPMAAQNITVSTVGLVRRMRRFSNDFEGRVQLALSLHAGTDAVRQQIVPRGKTTRLAQLKQALLAHPLPGSRKIMVEYVLLPGVNDGDEQVDGLADFMDGLKAMVNIIPFNPFADAPYRPPTHAEVESFWRRLKARRIPNTVRMPRGRASHGACGQLMLATT